MTVGPGLSPRATHGVVLLVVLGAIVSVGAGVWWHRLDGRSRLEGSAGVDPDVRGEQVYGLCVTCHERDGRGEPGRSPPLVGSAYVRGSPDALIRVALDGFQGSRTPAGRAYTERMTGFEHLSDSDLAAVLTYVRRSFGAGAPAIGTEDVRRVRGATSGRILPWTPQELQHHLAPAAGG